MCSRSRRAWLAYALLFVVLATLSISVLLHAARPPVSARAPAAPLSHLDAPALLRAYCAGCHRSRTRVELAADPTTASVHQDPALWRKVIRALRAEQMPPLDEPRSLHPLDRARLIAWVENTLQSGASARLAARHLAALEYRNAVRDLLGIELSPANALEGDGRQTGGVRQVALPADFPADDPLWALYVDEPSMPAAMILAYQTAAATVLNQVVESPDFERLGHAERCRVLENLARRAFRRPLQDEEIARLARHMADATPLQGFRAALYDVLTSPHFLYMVERRPDVTGAATAQFELASRLASFLWSSVPDEELLADAARGILPVRLNHHVARMLADRRAAILAPRFTNHWLHLQNLDGMDHVPAILRRAMRAETEHFVAFILQEDRDILEFLNADYTFLDETMARHYGIHDVRGDQVRRVPLLDDQRRGLLGHASLLTLTSYGFVTSPIRRGRWILENLLGERVPPPPVGMTNSNKAPVPAASIRRLQDPYSCGRCCHAPLLGLGTALEHYGSTGLWRAQAQTAQPEQEPAPIDAIGASPAGEPIAGSTGLGAYLLGQKDKFLRCLSSKLLTYGLDRKPRESDLDALDQIVEQLAHGPCRFTKLVQQVVASAPFQRGFVERWGQK